MTMMTMLTMNSVSLTAQLAATTTPPATTGAATGTATGPAPTPATTPPVALGSLAVLMLLLIVIGTVTVMGLLILWRLRSARRSPPARVADGSPKVDPWFEAGQRAKPEEPTERD